MANAFMYDDVDSDNLDMGGTFVETQIDAFSDPLMQLLMAESANEDEDQEVYNNIAVVLGQTAQIITRRQIETAPWKFERKEAEDNATKYEAQKRRLILLKARVQK